MPEQDANRANRRHFINLGFKGIAVLPLGFLGSVQDVMARSGGERGQSAAFAKLPESDRQAVALGYKEDASTVDTSQFRRKDDQFCANCQLFSGTPGDLWGPCAIFSYRIDRKLNKPYEVRACEFFVVGAALAAITT